MGWGNGLGAMGWGNGLGVMGWRQWAGGNGLGAMGWRQWAGGNGLGQPSGAKGNIYIYIYIYIYMDHILNLYLCTKCSGFICCIPNLLVYKNYSLADVSGQARQTGDSILKHHHFLGMVW